MSGNWKTSECSGLLALLAPGETDTADAQVAQRVAEHIASCSMCAQAEAALANLVAGYRRTESSSLPSEVERRLLDHLCPPATLRSIPEG